MSNLVYWFGNLHIRTHRFSTFLYRKRACRFPINELNPNSTITSNNHRQWEWDKAMLRGTQFIYIAWEFETNFDHLLLLLILFGDRIISANIFSCVCAWLSGNALFKSVAGDEMVICYTWSLHEGIDDCGAYTSEAPPHKVLADHVCFRSFHRNLTGVAESANNGFVVHKAPAVAVKWPKLFYDL